MTGSPQAERPGPTRLVLAAHGTGDRAGRDTVRGLAARVAALAGLDRSAVRVGWLGHDRPTLAEAVTAPGPPPVVVPLLLAGGYHAGVDVPAAIAAGPAGTRLARTLGPHPLLAAVLDRRLDEAGAPRDVPVLLAAAGSRDPAAAVDVSATAAALAARRGRPVTPVFLAAGPLDVAAGRVAVACYLLTTGRFATLAGSGARWVAAPLGDHPMVAAAVLAQARAAAPAD